MEAYKQRVVEERAELKARIDKLSTFIGLPAFDSLLVQERLDLWRQREAMQDYMHWLDRRIRRFS